MEKSETTFSRLFHKYINGSIYFEKMSNPYKSGTPDFYYENQSRILWVEHKWITKPWKANREASKICSTASWTHQRHWLIRAHDSLIPVRTIIGIGKGKGTLVYILAHPFTFDVDYHLPLTLEEAADQLDKLLVK